MVWMNALTEYYNAQNGTSLKPVYYSDSSYSTPIRDSSDGSYGSSVNSTVGSFDNPYIYATTNGNTDMANNTADGIRLPSADEWELAARYIDDGDGDIQDAGEYYPGNFVSGADAAYNVTASSDYDGDGDTESTNDVSWDTSNSGTSTHAVKTKSVNALGLYDMSGNVAEWNFDWDPADVGNFRVMRGFSWNINATTSQVGFLSSYNPYFGSWGFGFRPVRTP